MLLGEEGCPVGIYFTFILFIIFSPSFLFILDTWLKIILICKRRAVTGPDWVDVTYEYRILITVHSRSTLSFSKTTKTRKYNYNYFQKIMRVRIDHCLLLWQSSYSKVLSTNSEKSRRQPLQLKAFC